jgi:hypothetical protein
MTISADNVALCYFRKDQIPRPYFTVANVKKFLVIWPMIEVECFWAAIKATIDAPTEVFFEYANMFLSFSEFGTCPSTYILCYMRKAPRLRSVLNVIPAAPLSVPLYHIGALVVFALVFF